MKPGKYVAVIGLLNALTLSVSSHWAHAAAKEHATQRGGSADAHMSTKGQDNTNAQWSADPERGWVRADERHNRNQQKHNANDKSNRTKQSHATKAKNSR